MTQLIITSKRTSGKTTERLNMIEEQAPLNITPSGKPILCNPLQKTYDTPNRRYKYNLKLQEEQRLQQMLRTKPNQSNSILLPEPSKQNIQKVNDKRRDTVNKIKESLVLKFQNQVAVLHNKKLYQNGYADNDFCIDMKKLIEDTQTQLDKLKVNGKFYTYDVNCKEPKDQTLIIKGPLN